MVCRAPSIFSAMLCSDLKDLTEPLLISSLFPFPIMKSKKAKQQKPN